MLPLLLLASLLPLIPPADGNDRLLVKTVVDKTGSFAANYIPFGYPCRSARHCFTFYLRESWDGFAFDVAAPTGSLNCYMADPYYMQAANKPSGAVGTLDGYTIANPDYSITWTNMIVIGGLDPSTSSYFNSVELVDLSSSSSGCVLSQAYPMAVSDMAGMFLGGRPMVCGGRIVNQGTITAVSNCYSAGAGSVSWYDTMPMIKTRNSFATARLDANSVLFTGGGTMLGSTLNTTSASEVFSVGAGFKTTTSLPHALSRHCSAALDSNRVLLSGGINSIVNASIMDVSTGTFTVLPDMPDGREYPFCGVVSRANGTREFVVAGGNASSGPASSTMILSLATWTWRTSPTAIIPVMAYRGASVPYGNSFLLVGNGFASTATNKIIYQYNPDSETFSPMAATLSVARVGAAAFLVPPQWATCG